jgi:probable F420-dependent oxidoreductase
MTVLAGIVRRRVLAALGPKMLGLARDRAAGALSELVTADYTAQARELLGPDTALVVEQLIVPQTDPQLARQYARKPLGYLAQMPAYQAHFRRMGFTDDDISQLSDRLVDALVVWGDEATIAARVAEHRQAGADQIAVNLITGALGDVANAACDGEVGAQCVLLEARQPPSEVVPGQVIERR